MAAEQAAATGSTGTLNETVTTQLGELNTGNFWEGGTRRPKMKKQGARWDGRVSSLTLQEYREMKWGVDAGYRVTTRVGPKFTIRGSLPKPVRSNSDGMLKVDVAKALDKVKPSCPSFSMGLHIIGGQIPDSPGPQYLIPSTMDPSSHPTIFKQSGCRFGSEILQVLDEDAPAPGQYDISAYQNNGRYKKMPKWTVQGREAFADPTTAPTPGPGEYKYERSTRVGKTTPFRWTMQGKTEPLEQPRGERRVLLPGPGLYNVPGGGARNDFVASHKPPMWKLAQEPRGLL